MTVSLQLYSMRNGEGVETLLPKLPGIGITKVEAFAALLADPQALLRGLEKSGLQMPSSHMDLAFLESDIAEALKLARTFDLEQVIVPYLDEDQRPTDAAGYAALAKRLEAVGDRFRDVGITLAWHNHDFELLPLADGSIPLEVMFNEAASLAWEADLAWVIKGGGDPVDYLDKFGGRVTAVHVKDIAPEGENMDEDGWADLGDGVVDWRGLLSACRALPQPMEYILEHDNPSDPMRYAKRSAFAFKTMWEA